MITNNNKAWKPKILNLREDSDKAYLEELEKKNLIWNRSDTIGSQLEDLVISRNPNWEKDGINQKALDENLQDLVQEDITNYGVWIYFPWSGLLTHTLPESDYHELRLNRNQNKITRLEQSTLSDSTVGIIGLSVGNAVAISLAIEGVGGRLKLADFDQLDLSNMNRIRASVSDIGTPKTILCARQIYEINPFAKLELFEEGISENNIEEFLTGQHPLDVLVDECDDIRLKFLIRERARNHCIPVLMETSDRGMLDVERFDQEPQRLLFHGIMGNTSFSDIPEKMTTEEKVPYVAPIIGLETLSDPLAASMLEIGERISTWPQLGSDVLLGGASVCIAVRKILLGSRLLSGRYFIDVNNHLQQTPEPVLQRTQADKTLNALDSSEDTLGKPLEQTADFMKFLVTQATLAPSGGNSQPWKFHIADDCLSIFHDRQRSKNIIDPDGRGAYVGLGAAIENIRIAAEANNHSVEIDYLPSPTGSLKEFIHTTGEVVATIKIKKDPIADYSQSTQLYPYLSRRMTDRKTYGQIPLTPDQFSSLNNTASALNLSLQLLQSEDELNKIAEIIGEGDRLRFLCEQTHEELMSEIRWSNKEAVETKDGIDVESLYLTPSQLTGLKLIKRANVAQALRQQSGGSGLIELSKKSIKRSSTVGLLSIPHKQNMSILEAGQAVQQFWIKCTQLGLSLHPNTGLIYMFNSQTLKGFLTKDEQEYLNSLRGQVFEIFEDHRELRTLLLFRLSVGKPLQPTALRKPLSEVLLSNKT